MLKIRLAFSISITAALLTIIFAILSDLGIVALTYRTLISAIIFGVLGYLLGLVIEKFIGKLTNQHQTKGQNIDIIADEETLSDNEVASFSPLDPDTYEKISTNK